MYRDGGVGFRRRAPKERKQDMTAILGISGLYHDSAASLVIDGEVVAAAQEERFTRIKHDPRFPENAVRYCLREGGLGPSELACVVFYDKPFLKFERLLETYLAFAPRGFRSFLQAIPIWLREKLLVPAKVDEVLEKRYEGPVYFIPHHLSHAASAYFPSPFEEAAVITFDGVGEWTTASWGIGRGNRVELKQEIRFPHSLGMLYSAFTYYCGFRVNADEYKLMGLAPYGEPRYADLILTELVDLREDGSFWLNQRYFNYCQGLTMTSRRFERLFGGPPRRPHEPIEERHMDLAASVQHVTEEIMLRIVRYVHERTGLRCLCMAGGVALNCVANGRILREGPFEDLWIQPAAGDAGGALGAALAAWYQLLDNPRTAPKPDGQKGSFLGPSFTSSQVRACLDRFGAVYSVEPDRQALCDKIAEFIAQGKVVGHFAGRMEFGPRALGNRSILADPRNPETQRVLNLKIKFRESFRPFAPCCTAERVGDYFDLDRPSPYMLLVAPVKEKRRRRLGPEDLAKRGLAKLEVVRSDIPAVTHVDFSARIQTVDKATAPRLYMILKAFERRTGEAILVNTSFNIRGEPIVCTPEDAYRCFMYTDMDVLVLENCICLKEKQPPLEGAERYRRRFQKRDLGVRIEEEAWPSGRVSSGSSSSS